LWNASGFSRLPPTCSIDIYDAVLDQGVRTPAMFDGYLAERQQPVP
jgi:hypothetical protein